MRALSNPRSGSLAWAPTASEAEVIFLLWQQKQVEIREGRVSVCVCKSIVQELGYWLLQVVSVLHPELSRLLVNCASLP